MDKNEPCRFCGLPGETHSSDKVCADALSTRVMLLEDAIRNIIGGCRKSNCYRVIKKKRVDDFYIGEDLILAARDALEGRK